MRTFARRAVALASLAAIVAVPGPSARAQVPDKAAAAALLEQFRRSIWAESIFAEFDLREMPRRGDERVFHGRFWGARNERGPVTRFEVDGAAGAFSRHILIQGGPGGGFWTSDGPLAGTAGGDALLAPVVPDAEITPFDLVPMPYLYWIDADFTGIQRIRGRQACIYMISPPGDFASGAPGIKSVRVYLDTQYDAMEQSEVIGADGRVAKTLSLLELRKVGSRWIPRDVDVRNEATRDKTRLTLTGVAVGIPVDPSAFDPSLLGAPAAPITGDAFIRITQ